MSTYICGDVHGEFGLLNTFINKKSPDIILQCGDFGFWMDNPYSIDVQKYVIDRIKPNNTKIYWTPGNHEFWDLLESLHGRYGKEPIAIDITNKDPKIWYCPLGSILKIKDKTIMFLGGADSIDKDRRTIGIDWWPQELLTEKDVYYIENMWGNNLPKVDIVISHTCPTSMVPKMLKKLGQYDKWKSGKGVDVSCHSLQYIMDKIKPSQWYFGHWHRHNYSLTNGCRWTALSHIQSSDERWWTNLI